ncbi:hypothetical protein [Chitinophaga sp. RAB17]|uniref:hypothetical protein n=1 Tax=Chitinophaga sp. RAB17 TaxID=3233049 RepID=UPI003F928F05
MSASNLFIVMLENSQSEQLPINIFLTQAVLSGIVTNVYPEFAEIRDDSGKRCIIALHKIEAIQSI